jgi:hypothetical protein
MMDENTVDNETNSVHINGQVENDHQLLPLPPLSMRNIKCYRYMRILIFD